MREWIWVKPYRRKTRFGRKRYAAGHCRPVTLSPATVRRREKEAAEARAIPENWRLWIPKASEREGRDPTP